MTELQFQNKIHKTKIEFQTELMEKAFFESHKKKIDFTDNGINKMFIDLFGKDWKKSLKVEQMPDNEPLRFTEEVIYQEEE